MDSEEVAAPVVGSVTEVEEVEAEVHLVVIEEGEAVVEVVEEVDLEVVIEAVMVDIMLVLLMRCLVRSLLPPPTSYRNPTLTASVHANAKIPTEPRTTHPKSSENMIIMPRNGKIHSCL